MPLRGVDAKKCPHEMRVWRGRNEKAACNLLVRRGRNEKAACNLLVRRGCNKKAACNLLVRRGRNEKICTTWWTRRDCAHQSTLVERHGLGIGWSQVT